ncbi:hypothetical protein Hdeb2414_s0001g00032171 [Helianthus debilis subsp. tardiflorus]
MLYNCLFGHLWVGVNFSLHQKHSPLDLFMAISLVDKDLVLATFWVIGGEGRRGKWAVLTGGLTEDIGVGF